MVVQVTPHMAVIAWIYSDRLGSNKIDNLPEIEQTVISTLSLKSISINKSKSQAAGTFELVLAPNKNWIATLTPGSWITILMSRNPIEEIDLKKASRAKVKLFGRIDSVRINSLADQGTGARRTEYIVSGFDWGCIFNTNLYIDPALTPILGEKSTAVGNAATFVYSNVVAQFDGLYPLDRNIELLIKLWGTQINAAANTEKDLDINVKPLINYDIPQEAADYFNFKNGTTKNLGALIDIKSGKLKSLKRFSSNNLDEREDEYDGTVDAAGIITPNEIIGSHSMWNLIQSQSNTVLNENICDLRWEGNTPNLCVYRRIYPFLLDKNNLTRDKQRVGDSIGVESNEVNLLKRLSSFYKDLRKHLIPLEEVLSINAGTNWKDRLNFIEVTHRQPELQNPVDQMVKLNAQFYDPKGFTREGLRQYIATTQHYPCISNEKNKVDITLFWQSFTPWKYLLKEWHFNTHLMLNGTITFYGQDTYIQVGDNIIVDAKVLGPSYNMNIEEIKKKGGYLLAHVENIQHTGNISGDSRSFITSVSFVRGIITDRDGQIIGDLGDGVVNQDATKMNEFNEVNDFILTTPTYNDPDKKSFGASSSRPSSLDTRNR
jgi:hypothetical protein